MCYGCLREAIAEDGPVRFTPELLTAARYVQDVWRTPWADATDGGPLHIIVADDNVEDHFLTPEWVDKACGWGTPAGFTDDDRRLCLDTVYALSLLPTEAERIAAVELHCQGWPPVIGTILLPGMYNGEIAVASAWPRRQ